MRRHRATRAPFLCRLGWHREWEIKWSDGRYTDPTYRLPLLGCTRCPKVSL